MRILLGDEFTPNLREKVAWIKETFEKDQYRIMDIGFLYNDYCVEFANEKYATLFELRWPKQ